MKKTTPELLDAALRMVGITISFDTIEKIIDLTTLIEEKGNDVTMKDILNLKKEWKNG